MKERFASEKVRCVFIITLESEICFTCAASVGGDRSDRELRLFTQKVLYPLIPTLNIMPALS